MTTDAATPMPDRWISLELEPEVEAARLARDLVSAACARWHREDLAETAHIAVSELVNNAVIHARTPLSVRVTLRRDELLIAVRDRSPEPPRPRTPASSSYGGRGLMLLEAVSSRWGCAQYEDGKVVWAVLG
ncbi:ATP-binding protein [Phytohabitans kaempferiae]|uniref:ATP-binding protein n=1 Tax=Phytohabitans kaempferiae TaxID=1620943 RepID=A0ABV6M3J7_9ACTN